MERRLIERMFPYSREKVLSVISLMSDVDKDRFLRDCIQMMSLIPSTGQSPQEVVSALLSSNKDDAVHVHVGPEGPTVESRVVLTWRNLEMVALSHNPLLSQLQREERIAAANAAVTTATGRPKV